MINKLSSIRLAFYNLFFMAFLLGTGIYFSRIYRQSFKVMNDTALLDWFDKIWTDTPVIAVWFVVLCISATLLFINLFCCSFSKQMNMAVKSKSFQKWLFFILHCLFIIVLTSHGLMLFAGSKVSNAVLFPGESMVFDNQYEIQVSQVVFKDDVSILKAGRDNQRKLMTRKNIHRKSNYAEMSLFKKDKLLETKKVLMLSPLRYKSVQVTITDFIVNQKDQNDMIGIKLTITKNVLNRFFFIIYGLMIVSFGLYILLIFQNDSIKR